MTFRLNTAASFQNRTKFVTVAFSFGISENTVFSNAIDSLSFGRCEGHIKQFGNFWQYRGFSSIHLLQQNWTN
jgi:hypothetical protein